MTGGGGVRISLLLRSRPRLKGTGRKWKPTQLRSELRAWSHRKITECALREGGKALIAYRTTALDGQVYVHRQRDTMIFNYVQVM